MLSVTLFVTCDFFNPIGPIAFRNPRATATLMSVPEAAMHEHQFAAPDES